MVVVDKLETVQAQGRKWLATDPEIIQEGKR